MNLLGIVFFSCVSTCFGLRVLAVLPFPMKSHQIIFNAILGELVRRGHDVTVYSNTPLQTNTSNSHYRHFHITTRLESMLDQTFSFENLKSRIDLEAFIRPMGFQILTSNLSEEVLSLPQIMGLLNSNEMFDVIILETFFGQEALIGFGHRFSAPVVSISSFGSYSMIDSLMGNPNPLAYFTTYQLAYSSELTFYQKLKNVIATMSELHYSYFYHLPNQQLAMEKYFQKYVMLPLPPLTDLLKDIGVVLLNTQPEVSYARPWVPNMISVGGLHIEANRTPLPQDIQNFINDASDGFIYFSLGSTFSGTSLPQNIKEAFFTAFKQIPQRILWKITDAPGNLPPNVMTVKWVQQNDVLAQPNCRAFITHGGLLSMLEATYFAVPLLAVPVFADQPWNMVKAEQAQVGIRLRLLQMSSESVTEALHKILHEPKYKRNMDQLSAQMRDRLVSPLDTAVHWVEYVAKHQGAPQLRSPARNMSFYQYFLIDVVLFLTFSICFVLINVFILFSKLCNLILSPTWITLQKRDSIKIE